MYPVPGEVIVKIWSIDPLTKVFPDDRPPRSPATRIDVLVARGAVESAQIVLWLDADAQAVDITIEPPVSPTGECVEKIIWRRVEYVPARCPAFCIDPAHRLRPGPSFFPDVLMDAEALAAAYHDSDWCLGFSGAWPGRVALPIWLTLDIPTTLPPGEYTGSVTVCVDGHAVCLPLTVAVSPTICPAERSMKLTHWFSTTNIAGSAGTPLWSEEFWGVLRQWMEAMAMHRANVIFTPLPELLQLSRDTQGRLCIDFSRFDRWVELCIEAGAIGYIEGSHLAYGGWGHPFYLQSFIIAHADGGVEDTKGIQVDDARARAFLGELLPQLATHLTARGWFDRYYQHLADEPIAESAAYYHILSGLVREFAPGMRRLDAVMADESLVGAVDIWCPKSNEVEDHQAFWQARQHAGDEIWHYTCNSPGGAYPHNYLNTPLLGTRVLHWYNYVAGLSGYLHWGLNHWHVFGNTPPAPYADTESISQQGKRHLPAGDSHLVYPGPGGRPLDSIRHEMVREGIQDYELLKVLDAHDPALARKLAAQVLPSLREYLKDPRRFRRIRAKLLSAVAHVQQRETADA